MAFDLTAADAILKENYNEDVISSTIPARTVLLQKIPKFTDFTGDAYVQPVKTANSQSHRAGGLPATASNTTTKKFSMTTSKNYAIIDVDRELILASENDVGAFARGVDFEVRGAVEEMARQLNRQLYGRRDGFLGQVTVDNGSASYTVTNIDNFEVGMTIDGYDALTGGSQDANSRVIQSVTKTGTGTGTIVVDTDDAAVDTNTRFFREDSRGSEIAGLRDWVANTSSTGWSATLFGVDRSTSYRTQGNIIDGSTGTLIDLMNQGMLDVAKEGGSVDCIVTSFLQYRELINQLETTKQHYAPVSMGELGFKGIEIVGPYGRAEVYPDYFCPVDEMYLLTSSSFKFVSRGPLAQWADEDGRILLRSTSDTYQGRLISYSNLLCLAPIHNAQIKSLPTS